MMIVGSNGLVPPVPLDQYTGVVHFTGDAAAVPTSARCSATLLNSGRHLLTAGHCIVKSERQTILFEPVGPGPMLGTFRLNFDGHLTAQLGVNASAAAVETALEALPNIDNVNVRIDDGGAYEVQFLGDLAVTDVNEIFVIQNLLVNTSVTVNTTVNGNAFVGEARFDLPGGSFVFDPTLSETVIHPLWKDLAFNDEGGDLAGYDIAVVTLPAIAPLGAQRYSPYQDRDETENNLVQLAGYGLTGQGSTGESPDTAGVRRAGFNNINAIDDTTGYLLTDFDDGTDANNQLGGTGLGDSEVSVVRGDSGGPGLIGDRIAGVHALVSGAGWGLFGNVLYMTRVSDFVQNRDPLFDIEDIMATPDDIVLDMSLQPAGNDGVADIIDVQLVGPGDVTIQISINNQIVWSELRSHALSLTIRGSNDRDIVNILDDLNLPVTIYGEGGDDQITGGTGEETIYGGDGADELIGGSGNDFLIGGNGSDTLSGRSGNDRLIGGNHIASLDDEASDPSGDTINGDSGNDVIIGDDGSVLPLIIRQTIGGSDQIRGGLGNDVIYGGLGHDSIHGQGGDDTITAGGGNDTVIGGWLLDPGQTLADGNDYVSGGDGLDVIYGDNLDPSLSTSVSLAGGNDELHGGDDNDIILGQLGHDTLYGDGGNDLLNGGVGNDTMRGGTGNDTLSGEAGLDLLFGESQDDFIEGGTDNDIVVGGSGDDQLFGGPGNDSVAGELGIDLVVGGLGDDQLTGGDGNDTLIGGNRSLVGDSGADTIDGGADDDLILGDSGRTNPLQTSSNIGGADTIQGGTGNDTIYAMAGNDFVGGGEGNDVLYLGAGNDIASGDSGNDMVYGSIGDDILAGGLDNDQLLGESGNDWLIGGNFAAIGVAIAEVGDDNLDGGVGDDRLIGDSWSLQSPLVESDTGGNDSLVGGTGNDFLAGEAGNDILIGGTGNDELIGGSGDDTMRGDAGNDNLSGGPGNDIARGGANNDQLQGGLGNDILLGEDGDDTLQGNEGRDLLIGGMGVDRLEGGLGEDLLISGFTSFDARNAALQQILAEWNSVRTYASRIANLKGLPNPTFAVRSNGNVFLIKGTTVFDDASVDSLLGEAGRDWYLFSTVLTIDVLLDVELTEQLN